MNVIFQELENDHRNDDLAYAWWSQRLTTYQKFAVNYTVITKDHDDYALPIADGCYRGFMAFESRMQSGRTRGNVS